MFEREQNLGLARSFLSAYWQANLGDALAFCSGDWGDLNEKAGKALAAELGAGAISVKLDVSRAEDWKTVLQKGEERFGTVNVLVNNAGILGSLAAKTEMPEAEFLRVCATACGALALPDSPTARWRFSISGQCAQVSIQPA